MGMRFGGSAISWGRSELRNEKVGGHDRSLHITWEAVDVVFDTFEGMRMACTYARRAGIHMKKNGEKTMHYQIVAPEGFETSLARIRELEGG